MPWDGDRNALETLLARLFDEVPRSKLVLARAGVDISLIDFNSAVALNWFAILNEVEKQGKVDALIDAALRLYPTNPGLRARGSTPPPVKSLVDPVPPRTLDRRSQEAWTGTRSTLLPISWLALGAKRAAAVARVVRGDWKTGTGFLLRGNLFLTNNHVLPTREDARDAVLEFGFEQDEQGLMRHAVSFHLETARLFFTSPEHDWTVVAARGDANAGFGALRLARVEIAANDRVNIIQHPNGNHKQIALYHNLVTSVSEETVTYLTDTEPGSSGSPVFNSAWTVMALHAGAREAVDPNTGGHVYENEGINVNCILDDWSGIDLLATLLEEVSCA